MHNMKKATKTNHNLQREFSALHYYRKNIYKHYNQGYPQKKKTILPYKGQKKSIANIGSYIPSKEIKEAPEL